MAHILNSYSLNFFRSDRNLGVLKEGKKEKREEKKQRIEENPETEE